MTRHLQGGRCVLTLILALCCSVLIAQPAFCDGPPGESQLYSNAIQEHPGAGGSWGGFNPSSSGSFNLSTSDLSKGTEGGPGGVGQYVLWVANGSDFRVLKDDVQPDFWDELINAIRSHGEVSISYNGDGELTGVAVQ